MTGITDEMVKDCRSVKEVVPEFVDWVGDLPLLGHNLPFDYRFMVCVCKSLGIDFTLGGTRRGIDTLSLCRNLYSFVSNKLGDVVSQMHIQLNGAQYHRATFDANATKEVYEVIVRDYGSMTRVNTPILLKNKNEKTAEVGECESLSFS
jgi:DNA polymerase-3 subunit alpha (Gram-positive type)